MCGITGFSLTNDSCVNGRELMRALLRGIESRGGDATGFAAFTPDGKIVADALDVTASKYVRTKRMRRLDSAARTAIGHTRLATQGSYKFRRNNHPVLAWDSLGNCVAAVHNGSVWNDDDPFKAFDLPRHGEVDSEAIPAMLARFGSDSYAYTFNYLEGGIATCWLDEREPGVLHAVRAWDSPMVVAAIDTTTATGKVEGVLIASTTTALTDGLAVLGLSWADEGVRQFEIGEGEAFTVRDGAWDKLVYPFELPAGFASYGGFGGGRWSDYDWSWEDYEAATEHAGAASVGQAPADGSSEPMSEDAYMTSDDYDSSTYDDAAGANAAVLGDRGTRMAEVVDEQQRQYVEWWVKADGERILRQIADEAREPGWKPSYIDCEVLAAADDDLLDSAGFPDGFIGDLIQDPTVHERHCTTKRCVFDMDGFCQIVRDDEDADGRVLVSS